MADNKFLDQQGLSTLWSRIGEVYARVRRDNHYNYPDHFIPINREICLVDTARQGLRAKIGDGVTIWKDLPFTDDELYKAIDAIVQRGYYYEGVFYSDSAHTEELPASGDSIYIDIAQSKIYIYNNEYICINETLPNATAETAGILKLYTTEGQNTDGTMTQKAITDGLNRKVEASVDLSNEVIIFSN